MPKAVSPEEKLYVKDEIEKIRKDIKEDLEKASSKTTRTFATLALIIGVLTGLGIYGLAGKYIDRVLEEKTSQTAMAKIKEKVNNLEKEIKDLKTNIESKKIEVDTLSQKISEILNKANQTFIPRTENFITKTTSDISETKNFISETKNFIPETKKIQCKQICTNKSGPLPIEYGFTSNGGVVVLLVSGSAFRSEETGQIIIDVLVNNKSKGKVQSYVDKKGIHTFLTAFIVIDPPLAKGDHTVKLATVENKTKTNTNDVFSVIALELPKFAK